MWYKSKYNRIVLLIPKALIMLQRNATEQLYSVDAGYFFKNEEFYLLGGYNYRLKMQV